MVVSPCGDDGEVEVARLDLPVGAQVHKGHFLRTDDGHVVVVDKRQVARLLHASDLYLLHGAVFGKDHELPLMADGHDASLPAVDDVAEVVVAVAQQDGRCELPMLVVVANNLAEVAHGGQFAVALLGEVDARNHAVVYRPRVDALAGHHEGLQHGGVVDVAIVAVGEDVGGVGQQFGHLLVARLVLRGG